MPQEIINVGAAPNDGTGDTLRDAFTKCNDNFTELYLGGGLGSVTSVALVTPSFLNVAGSPITTAGTFTVTLAPQNANEVFAGPATGAAAAPTFRALVAADIPSLSAIYQPLDADLTAIGALTGTGYLERTGVNTWALSTPGGGGNVSNFGTPVANQLAIWASATTIGGDAGLTWSGTVLAATAFSGPLTGNVTGNVSGSSGSCTGNAASATVAATITVANEAADTTCFLTFVTDATGDRAAKTNIALTFNASTASLACTTFVGALTGNASTASAVAVGGITGLGTGIATALAINVGSAGAPVVQNGAGGTPSSITLTNGSGLPAAGVLGVNKVIVAGFTKDGGGSAITTGKVKGFFTCRQAGTIAAWSIAVDTGTCTVKMWKVATGTAVPTVANVINTSGVSISSGTYVRSTTVTDFTATAVAAYDIIAFDITAVSGATEITFGLEITPT